MKKIAAALLVAATAALSLPAHANLQNALNSMFMTNVTSPGAYQSAQRSGFVGGGISLRTPVKPINLVAFDPPRMNAGCGGIDMYGGSFTFINKNQFTQLLRNIMNNAIGLLFQAALQNISPSMSSLLNSFQKMVQDMNALASNTCAIANQAINSIKEGALDNDMKEAGARVGTSTGAFLDHFTGKAPESEAQSKSDNQQTEANNPAAGNFTWRALHRTQVADSIGAVGMVQDATDPNGNKPRQFMMSLIGTTVVTSYKNETNLANMTQPSSGETINPTISLLDLIDGDNLQVYSCSGATIGGDSDAWGPHSCVNLNPVALEMAGTRDYVKNMLYGDSTQTTSAGIKAAIAAHTPDAPGANSIYGKIFNCAAAGCNLNAAEQNFLMLAGPIFNLLKDAQYDRAAVSSLSQYIEDPLAVMVAQKMGEATIRAATTAWNGVTGVQMPANVNENIHKLGAQMNTLHTMKAQYEDNLIKARNIADTIRKTYPVLGQR